MTRFEWLRGRRMTKQELRDYVNEQRGLNNIPYHVYSTLINAIDTLEQEPRKGHWAHGKELYREYLGKTLIDVTYEKWHCSNCQYVIEQVSKPKWNYCPNCGADMRGEEV